MTKSNTTSVDDLFLSRLEYAELFENFSNDKINKKIITKNTTDPFLVPTQLEFDF